MLTIPEHIILTSIFSKARVAQSLACCVMLCRSFFFRFVLDQDAQVDLYSTSSLKQQSADIHVAPLGHQPVFAHSPQCCVLSGEATNTNCIILGSNPRSTVFEHVHHYTNDVDPILLTKIVKDTLPSHYMYIRYIRSHSFDLSR